MAGRGTLSNGIAFSNHFPSTLLTRFMRMMARCFEPSRRSRSKQSPSTVGKPARKASMRATASGGRGRPMSAAFPSTCLELLVPMIAAATSGLESVQSVETFAIESPSGSPISYMRARSAWKPSQRSESSMTSAYLTRERFSK